MFIKQYPPMQYLKLTQKGKGKLIGGEINEITFAIEATRTFIQSN
jgi:hypothetical protein